MIKTLFNKLKTEKVDAFEVKVNMLPTSKVIFNWLKEMDKTWSKKKDNPNCFFSGSLEALYVYENEIKYWEDIRSHSVVSIFPIPESKQQLEEYLANAYLNAQSSTDAINTYQL